MIKPVGIVGAGISGLTCALELQKLGVPYRLFEASQHVGGRVRTDVVDGFQLDRGFQVLLTAYPEARRLLDYRALELGRFLPGADVVVKDRRRRIGDPIRRPMDGIRSIIDPTGNWRDLLRTGVLREQLVRDPIAQISDRPEVSTAEYLAERRFSRQWIDRFLRPFLGGIFLERDLETSSRMFEFVFSMFSRGSAALPARGMRAIPEQLASRLDADSIELGRPVASVGEKHIVLEGGERVTTSRTVVATDLSNARRLLQASGLPLPRVAAEDRETRTVTCLYFDAPVDPIGEPILVLGGSRGVINNLCCPSAVRPEYAPEGRSLVSVTVVDPEYQDDPDLKTLVRQQLEAWFGESVRDWRSLQLQRIEEALPAQPVGVLDPVSRTGAIVDGPFLCGDHCEFASTNGAMRSGRVTASRIAKLVRPDADA